MQTTNHIKNFLQSHPTLARAYVRTSLNALHLVAKPLGSFMRHLCVIQGLDPDVLPSERDQQTFYKDLDAAFNGDYHESYQPWFIDKWLETRKNLKDKDMSEKEFFHMTDLYDLADTAELDRSKIKESPVEFNEPPEEHQQLSALHLEVIEKAEEDGANKPETNIEQLKKASVKKNSFVRDIKAKTKSDKRSLLKKRLAAKFKRISKLVQDMVARGLCDSSNEAVASQLKEMLLWPDKSVQAMARVIKRHPVLK
jgi:hypothetical protein